MRRSFRTPLFAFVCGLAGAVTAAWYVSDIEVRDETSKQKSSDSRDIASSILLRPFAGSRKQKEKLVQVNCEHLPDIVEAGHTVATDTRVEHEKWR